MPGEIEAATVDHRLRPESADEAAMVARVCEALGVPHRTLKVVVQRGNLQAEARTARYAALGSWLDHRHIEALATAHHAEDQAETLLMRLNRGSGLSGLAGIRARSSVPGTHRRLLRPLLGWRRAELEVVVRVAGLEPARDPSNQSEAFDRARVRKVLEACDWFDPLAFAKSASLIAEVERAIDWLATEELHDCAELGPEYAYYPYRRRLGEVAIRPLWVNVVQEMAGQIGCPLGKADAASLIESLERGEKRNIGGLQGRVERRGGEVVWLLAPESPRGVR